MVSDIARQATALRNIEKLQHDVAISADDETTVFTNTGDFVTVYSMIDGAPRKVRRLDAPTKKVLLKDLEDGTPAFWYENMPGSPPEYKVGDIHCMLHPDFDESGNSVNLSGLDRAFVDLSGLTGRTCNMSSPGKINRNDFRSVFDRNAHMASKHRDEWKIIQDAVERHERDDERQERQSATDAMLELAQRAVSTPPRPAPAPRPAAPTVEVPSVEVPALPAPVMDSKVAICTVCGKRSKTAGLSNRHMATKLDDAHKAARGE